MYKGQKHRNGPVVGCGGAESREAEEVRGGAHMGSPRELAKHEATKGVEEAAQLDERHSGVLKSFEEQNL